MLVDYPLFGEVSAAEQMRKVRAPVRIRLDAWGGIHALADAPLRTPARGHIFIHHFDAEGRITGKTLVPANNQFVASDLIILDFVADTEGNTYFIEQIHSRQSNLSNNRLRKVSKDGDTLWSRTGAISGDEFELNGLKGNFKRLLMDGNSRLYLPATEHAGIIAEINPVTGNVMQVYTSDKYSNKIFMNEKGIVLYVLYFPEVNRRGLGYFNLADQRLKTIVGGIELYGGLLYPFGVDAASNLYTWNDFVIAKISSDGHINVIAMFDNLTVRSNDGTVFTSHLLSDDGQSSRVLVESYSPRGEFGHIVLSLPEELQRRCGGWKLIHVDKQDRYYVFGGEEPGQAGVLLIYSKDNKLEEAISPPPDLLNMESTLEHYSLWEVDSHGRIYLPVIDAEGFKIVRLTEI